MSNWLLIQDLLEEIGELRNQIETQNQREKQMYFVIQQAWSQRLIIPMNDATSAAVRHLFGDKAQMVEEYYVEKEGSAFEQLPNKVIIEIWTKERVDEYIDRGLEHPRKPR